MLSGLIEIILAGELCWSRLISMILAFELCLSGLIEKILLALNVSIP